MAQLLRQSTLVTVIVGPMLDASDGSTEENALTLEATAIRTNGTTTSVSDTGSTIVGGAYELVLTATDTAIVGPMTVYVKGTGARPVAHQFQVVEEAVYDALYASGAAGLTPVSASTVAAKRTWYADGYRARNIVEVTAGFDGTLALVPDLNPDTTISTVSTVTFDGPASVTASNLTVRTDKKAVHFDTPALSTVGTYTVTVTVVTVDSQTIVTTGTLKVN